MNKKSPFRDRTEALTGEQSNVAGGTLTSGRAVQPDGLEISIELQRMLTPNDPRPKPGDTSSTSPKGYLDIAREYLRAVCVMASDKGAPVRPSAHLAGQTLECTLKAYIGWVDAKRLQGGELRGPKGHELLYLWEEAVKASRAAAKKLEIPTDPPDWVRSLAFFHAQPYLDRYPIDQGFMAHMRGNSFLAGELETLVKQAEAALQS